MAILKIKDQEGNIIDIPAIRGERGKDGYTPQKGVDYFTDEDIAELKIPSVDQTYTPDSDNAQSGKAVAEAITKKANKPKVTTITVDTPIWTNQPTIVGDTALHRDFKKWIDDFYYCTLKNADGSALPSGQFKLMTKYNDPTTAIDQIFQLSNLFTGNSDWLSENMTIDFKEVGNSWKMRNGGVSSVECSEKVLNREIYVSGYFSASAEGTTYFQYFPNINNGVTYSNVPDYFYGDGSFVLFWAISVNPNTHKMALASAVFKVKALNSIMICDGCYTARTFLKRADISTNKGVGNFCSDNSTLGTLIKNDGTAITLDDITDLPFFTYGANHGEILNGTNIMFVDEV
jgi:hypothetical protein